MDREEECFDFYPPTGLPEVSATCNNDIVHLMGSVSAPPMSQHVDRSPFRVVRDKLKTKVHFIF